MGNLPGVKTGQKNKDNLPSNDQWNTWRRTLFVSTYWEDYETTIAEGKLEYWSQNNPLFFSFSHCFQNFMYFFPGSPGFIYFVIKCQ